MATDLTGKFIVKIQWPVDSNDSNPCAMIYTEDRAIYHAQPCSDELWIQMGGTLKAYFLAEMMGTTLNLIRRVPDQEDW